MVKEEINFLGKVVRNGAILAGLYFISVWASTKTLNLEVCKPVILFLGTYILTELATKYGLNTKDRSVQTLLF